MLLSYLKSNILYNLTKLPPTLTVLQSTLQADVFKPGMHQPKAVTCRVSINGSCPQNVYCMCVFAL